MDKVGICNNALMLIGGNGDMTGFTDDTREAEVCRRVYDTAKYGLLTSYPWRFSIKRATLTLSADAPLYEWQHKHLMPPDCLRVISIEDAIPFDIEGDYLLSNSTVMRAKYQIDMIESEWPEYFVEVLVYKLAVIFATAIAEDAEKAALFRRELADISQRAKAIDGGQRTNVMIPTSKLLNVRHIHGRTRTF